MGSRGGGRGRGRFGGGDFRYAKQEPFVLFPEIELPDRKNIPVDKGLVIFRNTHQLYFPNSPYFIEETLADEGEAIDIERYSDKEKNRSSSGRLSLLNSGYLKLEPGYFPLELLQGTKRRIGRKVQWNPKRDLKKLDILEQLEEKHTDEDPKSKKDGEEEEEEENLEEGDEDDDEEEGDYYQNVDFEDDDDGGYNDIDGGNDEWD